KRFGTRENVLYEPQALVPVAESLVDTVLRNIGDFYQPEELIVFTELNDHRYIVHQAESAPVVFGKLFKNLNGLLRNRIERKIHRDFKVLRYIFKKQFHTKILN